ncbi:DUF885 domain-containing protein [Microbulbifer agarilyticus]|uniref:DUF885 domain-containing protein n=1 Tax=Microbulbifer agarilyticus TaxID=260552 RepID=UPI001C96C5AB|nr:DUF885 domain-containing protein [Microbulbifer agarilyticus]MBY6190344.1 DUF885 domain-containing protein [Microbulbifer agarilyticus]
MKKILKYTGGTLLAAIVAAGGIATHEVIAEKPFSFRVFIDRPLVSMAFDSPEMLTSLGFLESMGIKGHNARLDETDPEKTAQMFADFKQFRATLDRYEGLDENEELTRDIATYLADMIIAAEPYRYHTYPVNQLFGVQNGYPSFMEAQHRVEDLEDAQNYLSRLQAVESKFGAQLEDLKVREERGIVPPRFVIDRVLDEMRGFVETPAQENILYTALVKKLDEAEDIDAEAGAQILATAEQHIEQYVYPAYQDMIGYFSNLSDRAGNDHGYWHLPEGEEVYKLALKMFTTTDYTPDQIHELGLSEVQRIQSEILTILNGEGFDTSVGFTATMADLAARPEFYYEDTEEGRAQILQDYQKILDEIDEGIDGAFRVRPKAGMEVVRIPEFKEKTAPGAYYEQPALDGSRPGRFFANLYDIKATPKYGMRTLAYHEGIPGHHFQIAIAMELEGMPFMRRMAPFTAYIEGWALYAEQVAWELGYQDNPYDNVGRLVGELFRAVRLVVDTGIHHKRWTREQGIEYMLANTGMAESDVVSEIERYIVMPGQATSYKIGMIKILELREKAMQELGDQFDLRDFHDVVLKNGAVPLDILEKIVDRYIADTKSGFEYVPAS